MFPPPPFAYSHRNIQTEIVYLPTTVVVCLLCNFARRIRRYVDTDFCAGGGGEIRVSFQFLLHKNGGITILLFCLVSHIISFGRMCNTYVIHKTANRHCTYTRVCAMLHACSIFARGRWISGFYVLTTHYAYPARI